MRILFLLLVLVFFVTDLSAQNTKKFRTKYRIEDLQKVPSAPKYEELSYWIAHPDVKDYADKLPGKGQLVDGQADAEVDVFFIYPTIYSGKQKKDHPWFADVSDESLNKEIAKSTIQNQATVFNGVAKVYSPLYRQAHIGVFYQDDLKLQVEALEYAYLDVKEAFEYYMKNWNNRRPVIIASHSQGARHAVKLIRDFFENTPLQSKLVAAYIVGMPLRRGTFEAIPICETGDQIGCWVSWNTFAQGYFPPTHSYAYDDALSINPLSWKSDTTYVGYDKNVGAVLRNFNKIQPGVSDGQNHAGMLWINRPQFLGSFLFNWDRYHIADYNLFYMNIRNNAELRVKSYLSD